MSAQQTRRAILAGIAATPVLGVPIAAASHGVDPIFAAIERHRAAEVAMEDYVRGLGDEDIDPKCPGYDAVSEAADEAAWELMCNCVPTTLAGAAAALCYVAQGGPSKGYEWPNQWVDDRGDEIDVVRDLIGNVAEALQTIAVRS